MNNMLRFLFIGGLLFFTTAAFCKNKKEINEPAHRFCVNVNAGLGTNYDTWFLEIQGEYNPLA